MSHFLMVLSLPAHLQYAVRFTLGVYSVMSEFTPGGCVHLWMCVYDLIEIQKKDKHNSETIGDRIKILFKRIPQNKIRLM